MADVKISELSDSGALDGSELVPIVQSGVTVKTTAQDIADLASSFTPGNLTAAGADGISVTGGANAVNGAGTSVQQQAASSSLNGYLTSANWTLFNSKMGGVLPTNIQEVFVNSLQGSDVTGTGSYDKPWATIAYACTQISDSSSNKPYAIRLCGARQNETANVLLPPYVSIHGPGQRAAIIRGSGGAQIKPSAAHASGTSWNCIKDVYISSTIPINWDLQAIGGSNNILVLENISCGGSFTYKGRLGGGGDFLECYASLIFGAVTLDSVSAQLQNIDFLNSVTVTDTQSTSQDSTFLNCAFENSLTTARNLNLYNAAYPGSAGITTTAAVNLNTYRGLPPQSRRTLFSGTTLTIADIEAGNTGFAFWDNTDGELRKINGWGYFDNTLGLNVNLDQSLDDTGGYTVHGWQINLIPTVSSPSSTYNFHNLQINIDPGSSGFNIGTGGSAAYMFNLNFQHQGTSNIGSLNLLNSYANIGNGTDPIDIAGYYGFFIFGDFNDNVNLSKGFQGYIFQPHVHSAATFTIGGAYTNVFGDFANVETACDGWSSFSANPTLAGIHTNNNYNGFACGAEVQGFTGNAGFTAFAAYPNITAANLGTGGVRMFTATPNIANLDQNSAGMQIFGQSTAGSAEWIGLDIGTNSIVTTGRKRGLRINTDRDLTQDWGALEVTGAATIQSNAQLVSSLTQAYCNVIGGQITIPDATAITGTDVIGNNMAVGVDLGDATSTWTAASIVGITTLGFVGQIVGDGTATGSINFCLAGFAAAFAGHVDRINNYFAAAIPAGFTGSVDEHVLYHGDMPAGVIATDTWGLRLEDSTSAGIENFLTRLAIGTSNFKVTNSSVKLEVGGTDGAIRFPNLTTTEILALTPLAGMMVFDTTLSQMAYYNGTIWVNF